MVLQTVVGALVAGGTVAAAAVNNPTAGMFPRLRALGIASVGAAAMWIAIAGLLSMAPVLGDVKIERLPAGPTSATLPFAAYFTALENCTVMLISFSELRLSGN